jgi:hypothetical protein
MRCIPAASEKARLLPASSFNAGPRDSNPRSLSSLSPRLSPVFGQLSGTLTALSSLPVNPGGLYTDPWMTVNQGTERAEIPLLSVPVNVAATLHGGRSERFSS